MHPEATWNVIRQHIDRINALLSQLNTDPTQHSLAQDMEQALNDLDGLAPFLPSGRLTDMIFYPDRYGLPDQPSGEEVATKACMYHPLITPAPAPETRAGGHEGGGGAGL